MKYHVFACHEMLGERADFPQAVELFLTEVRARIRSLQPCGFEDGYRILAVMEHGNGTLSMSLSITEVMKLADTFDVIDDAGNVRKGLSVEADITETLFWGKLSPIHGLAHELGILGPL